MLWLDMSEEVAWLLACVPPRPHVVVTYEHTPVSKPEGNVPTDRDCREVLRNHVVILGHLLQLGVVHLYAITGPTQVHDLPFQGQNAQNGLAGSGGFLLQQSSNHLDPIDFNLDLPS